MSKKNLQEKELDNIIDTIRSENTKTYYAAAFGGGLIVILRDLLTECNKQNYPCPAFVYICFACILVAVIAIALASYNLLSKDSRNILHYYQKGKGHNFDEEIKKGQDILDNKIRRINTSAILLGVVTFFALVLAFVRITSCE
ncbi:MAG: hypothetical protein QM529_04140 [Hydrotalea sp.]|nr:hypothetical protein [Hydrotalea sp.]